MAQYLSKHQRKLAILAVIAACVFSIALTYSGLTNLGISLATNTFSNRRTTTGVSGIRAIVTVAFLILEILYVTWLLWLVKVRPRSANISNYAKFSAIILLLVLIAYPYSSDVYLYLQSGLMALNGVNPYLVPPLEFQSALLPVVEWQQTSTYGPIAQLLFMSSAWIVPFKIVLGVYLFKSVCLLFHLMNTGLIWWFLSTNKHRSYIALAYLLNPVILNEQVVNAHLDVFLCTAVIGAIGCFYTHRSVLAVLALLAGFFTKILPIIWVPLVAGFFIRQRRWKELGIAIGWVLAIVLVLSYTVFPTPESWRSLLNPGVGILTARSLHHIIFLGFRHLAKLPDETARSSIAIFQTISYLGFAIFYAGLLGRQFWQRTYSAENLVADLGWSTLVLFLFATPWLMPWYPTVLLPIALLMVKAPRFLLVSLAFGLLAGVVIGAGNGDGIISLVPCLLTVGVPIGLLFLNQPVLQPVLQPLSMLQKAPSNKWLKEPISRSA